MLADIALLAGCSLGDTEDSSQAGEKPAVVEEPVGRAAEQTDKPPQAKGAAAGTVKEEPTMESRCYREKEDEIRIGDFEPPEEDVPEYEIIEETSVERDGAEAVRLLVDTQARSEEDYTLITRDIKSRYA